MIEQAVRLDRSSNLNSEVARLSPSPHKVAVASGKGGVGKSNIALNLGISLAQSGARVLLIDGNVNLSNLDILSGVSPSQRLFDVIEGRVDLKDAVQEIEQNVFLLAGMSDGRLKKLGSGEAASLFRIVSMENPMFQYAVIDTAGGIVQESISLALLSDEVFIVSTPEPTAIMDAYILVKVLNRINQNADLKLLVNRSGDALEAEDIKMKFDLVSQRFLNLKIDYAGRIPFDDLVEKAVSAQVPLVQRYPDAPSSQAIKAIAGRILEEDARKNSGKQDIAFEASGKKVKVLS